MEHPFECPVTSKIIQRAAAEFIHDRDWLGAFVSVLLRDAHALADVIR